MSPNQCQWVRQPLPSGPPTSIAFAADCLQSQVFFNRGATEGLVFAIPVGQGPHPLLWKVDFTTSTAKPVDLKGLPGADGKQGLHAPSVVSVGFDAQGAVVALISDEYQDRKPEKDAQGSFLLFEGKRYPVPPPEFPEDEGWPGLALAYRWEAGGWKRVEIKGTRYRAANAPELNALEINASLVVQQAPSSDISSEEQAPKSVAKKLDATVKKVAPGMWMYVPTPNGILYYRAVREGEDDYFASAPIRWDKGGKLVELAGLGATPGNQLAFQLQQGLLLIRVKGETQLAEVFDSRSKQKLISVKDVRLSRLWPLPAKP
ncbi:hypothetical protein [Melittangium boletus]|uniref:hypothetical protein n=1 Tax=Melittangium boletus TaxID=83453 RepID=UPI003DA4FFF1